MRLKGTIELDVIWGSLDGIRGDDLSGDPGF